MDLKEKLEIIKSKDYTYNPEEAHNAYIEGKKIYHKII